MAPFPYVVIGYLTELMMVKMIRLQGEEVAALKKAERRRKVIEKEGRKAKKGQELKLEKEKDNEL